MNNKYVNIQDEATNKLISNGEHDIFTNNIFSEWFTKLKTSKYVQPLVDILDQQVSKTNESSEALVNIILEYELYQRIYKDQDFKEKNIDLLRTTFDCSFYGASELLHIYRNIKSLENYSMSYEPTAASGSTGLSDTRRNSPSCFSIHDFEEKIYNYIIDNQGKKIIDAENINDKLYYMQGCGILDDVDKKEVREIYLYPILKDELTEDEKETANTLHACRFKKHPLLYLPDTVEDTSPICNNIRSAVLDCKNRITRLELDLIVNLRYERILNTYGLNREQVTKEITKVFNEKLNALTTNDNNETEQPNIKSSENEPMFG